MQWAETIWAQSSNIIQSFDSFVAHFREVFGRPYGDPSASDQLYHLRQGSLPIKEYALRFRTLAAASGCHEQSLLTTYQQGLEPRLRLQLAGYDDKCGLENLIQHSVRCLSRMQSCFDESPFRNRCTPSQQPPVSYTPPELMVAENMRFSFAERQRRISKGLYVFTVEGM